MQHIEREPCPWRVVDDAGGALIFGLVGGSIWHGFGGIRNAPNGQRIAQAISRVKARVPVLGGSFAVWGTLYSVCDCTFTYVRKKEDPWNAIISGAATGGILAIRAGPKAAARNAVAGGCILAAIEGLNLLLMRVLMRAFEQKQNVEQGLATVDTLLPPVDPMRRRGSFNKSNGGRSQAIFEAAPSSSAMHEGGNQIQFESKSADFEMSGFGKSVEIGSTEKVDEPKKSTGWLW